MDRVCPLLGLAGDPRIAMDGVDAAHRCHAEQPPAELERSMQAGLCLTASHPRCERYRGWVARTGIVRPGRAPFADGVVSTRMVLTPEPTWRGIAGKARRAPRGPVVAGGVAVAVLGIGGVALASAIVDGRLELAAAVTPSPLATATSSPTASPAPTPAPTPAVSPSPSDSARPTPTPATATPATATPTVAPTPAPTPVTYVVQEGDTLAEIAQQFGSTVEALQAANDIDDPDEIVIGDVLTIP